MARISKSANIPIRGDLDIYVRNSNSNRLLRHIGIKNTLTNGCYAAIVNLLRQATSSTPSDYKVSTLRVGTGVVAPTRADTALGAEVASITLLDASTENSQTADPFALVVTTSLPTTEGNGNTLTEAGLFLANGTLFARQTHPAIPKSSAITLDYIWRISLTPP